MIPLTRKFCANPSVPSVLKMANSSSCACQARVVGFITCWDNSTEVFSPSSPTRRASDLVVQARRPQRDRRPEQLARVGVLRGREDVVHRPLHARAAPLDRKSTRLNSSHVKISYAVFCLKKKKIHRVTERARSCATERKSR